MQLVLRKKQVFKTKHSDTMLRLIHLTKKLMTKFLGRDNLPRAYKTQLNYVVSVYSQNFFWYKPRKVCMLEYKCIGCAVFFKIILFIYLGCAEFLLLELFSRGELASLRCLLSLRSTGSRALSLQ